MKNLVKKINWDKGGGLLPTVIQDADTNKVLMLGYMNSEALAKTLKTKKIWFYSRSKKRLWMKGETSKNILNFIDFKIDCDNDALLIKVNPNGPACHTGGYSCFKETREAGDLKSLFRVVQDRKNQMPKDSYTAALFKAGLDKISLKVAEESLEVVHAAQKESQKRLVEEAVDLLYHLFVLLAQQKIDMQRLNLEIKKRAKIKQ